MQSDMVCICERNRPYTTNHVFVRENVLTQQTNLARICSQLPKWVLHGYGGGFASEGALFGMFVFGCAFMMVLARISIYPWPIYWLLDATKPPQPVCCVLVVVFGTGTVCCVLVMVAGSGTGVRRSKLWCRLFRLYQGLHNLVNINQGKHEQACQISKY